MSQWSFEEYYQPCIPQGQKEWHGIIVQADLAWMPGRCNWENRTSKERNEPEIILDEVARKELGHREWKLSLRGILFCPRKWIPNRSPVDLLPAVGEGVRRRWLCLSHLWSFITIQVFILDTYLPGDSRSGGLGWGLGPPLRIKVPPPFYGVPLNEFFNLWSHAKVHSDISCWKHCSEA